MSTTSHRLFQQPWPTGDYRFFQLGFLVDDVVAAAAKWAAVHGVGPFHVLPPLTQPWMYRGAEVVLTTQVAVAQAGPVQIELIQEHGDVAGVYSELARREGRTGFHQLCTLTESYDRTREHYAALGYELISEVTAQGGRVGFFDTLDDFGFYTEVAESTPTLVPSLARIAATCAEWDGTDPVRILTRDGYRVP